MLFRLRSALVLTLLGGPAGAAEIKTLTMRDGTAAITLEGEIKLEDGARFAQAASGADGGLVIFASPGGNLLAGLRIGQFIRLHEFRTLVPDGQRCASACALAWLGGTRRFMQPSGQVGFHAAYIREANGEARETGAGNALVGAYLSRLGLEDEAILYIENAHPDQITWLRDGDARRVGIAVSILPSFDRTPDLPKPVPPPPTPRPGADMQQAAVSFAGAYFAHWSESNHDALSYFRKVYSPLVEFYGQTVGSATVLNQKERFAERWPERLYAVRADTVRASCAAGTCEVTGVVDWDARNTERLQRTAGSAMFHLQLGFRGGNPSVLAEGGSVLSRDSTDGPPARDPPAAEQPAVGQPAIGQPATAKEHTDDKTPK